jgi:predicted nucleic acid-binding protein
MKALVDTNILSRMAEPGHAMSADALNSTRVLGLRGYTLHIVPQNLYEFWVVCTRPIRVNGLGKSLPEAIAELNKVKALFTLLDDTPALYPEWERLVATHAVLGKNAHDARLAAAMLVHGVTHLLTFNDADFRRFPGITVLTPAAILASPPALPPPAAPPPTPWGVAPVQPLS